MNIKIIILLIDPREEVKVIFVLAMKTKTYSLNEMYTRSNTFSQTKTNLPIQTKNVNLSIGLLRFSESFCRSKTILKLYNAFPRS